MPSVRDQYARKIISEHQEPYERRPNGIPPLPSPPNILAGEARELSIGIIGAGAAGLYIGMTLEKVNRYLRDAGMKPIKYEILEAEPSAGPHPVGGRMWTHHFGVGANDYYVRSQLHSRSLPY